MTKTNNNYFNELFKKSKVILAPMAGITNLPYRLFEKKMGCKILMTEMVSAKGLYYNGKKTFELMQTLPEEHTDCVCGLQIFGSDKEVMTEITKKYLNATDYEFIDINMGCPVKKVVNNGDGSALLKNPELAGEITQAVKNASHKPVSVKIRTGFTNDEIITTKMIKILEEAGADLITVHGRTREQIFTGSIDINEITKAKETAKHIPICGNGDILNVEDAKSMFDATNCDAIMIGRGANYNPFIWSQIDDYLNGKEIQYYTDSDKFKVAREQFDLVLEYSTSKNKIREFRKFLFYYIKGIKNAAKLRNHISKLDTKEDVYRLFDEIDSLL